MEGEEGVLVVPFGVGEGPRNLGDVVSTRKRWTVKSYLANCDEKLGFLDVRRAFVVSRKETRRMAIVRWRLDVLYLDQPPNEQEMDSVLTATSALPDATILLNIVKISSFLASS